MAKLGTAKFTYLTLLAHTVAVLYSEGVRQLVLGAKLRDRAGSDALGYGLVSVLRKQVGSLSRCKEPL